MDDRAIKVMTIAESCEYDRLNRRLNQRLVVKRMHEKDTSLTLEEASAAGVAPWKELVREDFHVAVFKDAYPVTPGHLLFVPKYFSDAVIKDCFDDALATGRQLVSSGECAGFNIGFNAGSVAGQTVSWPHVHLIPRRLGDTKDPIGGVRNVIPFAGNYKRKVGWLKKVLRHMAL